MKKLPIIRHVRYFWLKYQMIKHYDFMAQLGFIPIVGESDIKALEMIWRGEL
jgi:hypothetical protein